MEKIARLGEELSERDGSFGGEGGVGKEETFEVGVDGKGRSESSDLKKKESSGSQFRLKRREERKTGTRLTPSSPGPQQGLWLKSSVSRVELYFCERQVGRSSSLAARYQGSTDRTNSRAPRPTRRDQRRRSCSLRGCRPLASGSASALERCTRRQPASEKQEQGQSRSTQRLALRRDSNLP